MSSRSFVPSFECTVSVEAADIDLMGHVNNIVYLHWVQEVATAHWRSLAGEDDQKTVLWVVSRHEIDYKHPALLGDEVLLRTWVGSVKGLTFERHTQVQRAADKQILAVARTLWIPVNASTRRPQRLSAALKAQFSVEENPITETVSEK
jgi:acyl-CoA thioester hydrolase